MDINIKVEIIPSSSLVTLINALLLFNHPNPTIITATGTKSEVAKNIEVAEKAAASVATKIIEKTAKKHEAEEVGNSPDPKLAEVKQAKKNSSVTLESLKSLATTLKTETEFDVKTWLKQRGCQRMGDLKEDDYSNCFNDLMKIAGENNVQTF